MFVCPEELFLYRKIIKTLNRGTCHVERFLNGLSRLDEDLPMFPIESLHLPHLKRRVRLAAEISKLHHQVAKVANENNWYQKAAKELDIELDDTIEYEHLCS
jgi:ATP-dependent RNA helicase DDX24/MAK5